MSVIIDRVIRGVMGRNVSETLDFLDQFTDDELMYIFSAISIERITQELYPDEKARLKIASVAANELLYDRRLGLTRKKPFQKLTPQDKVKARIRRVALALR